MNLKERKTGFIATDQTINAYLKDINRYKVLSAAEEAERAGSADVESRTGPE